MPPRILKPKPPPSGPVPPWLPACLADLARSLGGLAGTADQALLLADAALRLAVESRAGPLWRVEHESERERLRKAGERLTKEKRRWALLAKTALRDADAGLEKG